MKKCLIKNPWNGEIVGEIPEDTHAVLEKKIERVLKGERIKITSQRRGEILERISKLVGERAEELAKTISVEAGKPINLARIEVERAKNTFKIASEEAKRIEGNTLDIQDGYTGFFRKFPYGATLGITPFNFPLNLVVHKVAPAIAAGCPIIIKPAPKTPLSSFKLKEITNESGLPDEMLQVTYVSNELAKKLVKDPRLKILSFTGSAKVGWFLKNQAGRKKVILELGGNAAGCVFEDAEIDWAASRLAQGAYLYAGQICISVQRILVQRSIYREFKEKFIEEVKKMKVVPPWEEGVLSCMISETEAKRVENWLKKCGGKIQGGKRDGNRLTACVVEKPKFESELWREEVFGPVAVIVPFKDFDEAVSMINDTDYGLHAGVFTSNIGRALRAFDEIETGSVIINDYPTFRVDHMPYGGIKDSGIGREGPKYAIEEMTFIKTCVIKHGSR